MSCPGGGSRGGGQAHRMTNAEFGSIKEFPTGGRFSVGGEAAEIRIKESETPTTRGMNAYFTSRKAAQNWIDKKHAQIIRQALKEGKTVPKKVLVDYPQIKVKK